MTEVGVMVLSETEVPFTTTLPGRAVAKEQTEIRPRVEGVIEEIAYTAGQRVEAGDLLFRLDAETYEAAYASAEAARDSAEATLITAQAAYDRYTKLEGVGASTSDLESARATLAQAKASVKSAEADLKQAQLDLDRVEIRSPIAGIPDVPEFSVGSLVTANQSDALTTVTRLDPIYVDVSESSARLMRIREQVDAGTLTPGKQLDVTLTLENGEVYDGKGTLISPGVTVSTTTGSIDLRFEFDNPDRLILPGQFLRVDVTLGTSKAILVPQRATTRQSDGTLTAFVAEDGTAHQVTLSYSETANNAWIVTDGVSVGDEIILDGLTNLTDGATITTVPVTINDAGVVEDAASDDSDTTTEAD
ncbi:efflux RND transporter periplasmic adaptor subunit [Celeribacter ethanolicus]|uniref:efflux RND transporter periplasmic adaptor subunit n=1 Tax=Celeribacter ethanolicus TaxID=1758178 RepID=UPI001EE3CE7A|nr:efflux RND transporter periplasmic adaptor subunit [Celeribacter ethanolicus]